MVEISLIYKDEEEYKIEKVLAEKIGDYYQMKAVPAFANNIAYNDIVSAEDDNGELFFDKLIEPSGHSTIHIVIMMPEFSSNIFVKLATYGVGLNYLHNNTYVVMDIPVNVPYKEVKSFLDLEFELGHLDYREACLGSQHRMKK